MGPLDARLMSCHFPQKISFIKIFCELIQASVSSYRPLIADKPTVLIADKPSNPSPYR